MVNLLRNRCRHMTALVPLNCESAATMLALGADEIQMGPMAFLTPVDTKVYHDLCPIDNDNDRVRIGTNELDRIIEGWQSTATEDDDGVFNELWKYIHPLAIAAAQRAGTLSAMLCNQIMSYHIEDEAKREEISRKLNSDYPAHSYPIVPKEARRIGISAVEMDHEVNDLLIQLNDVYSTMGNRFRTDYDPPPPRQRDPEHCRVPRQNDLLRTRQGVALLRKRAHLALHQRAKRLPRAR